METRMSAKVAVDSTMSATQHTSQQNPRAHLKAFVSETDIPPSPPPPPPLAGACFAAADADDANEDAKDVNGLRSPSFLSEGSRLQNTS
jgi:hypothetical protein